MATRFDPKLVEHNKPSLRQNAKISRGSASVSFQPKLSFYSVSGSGSEYHDGENEPDEGVGEVSSVKYQWWKWIIEDKRAKQGFRVLSLANLIVLLLSIPFFPEPDNETDIDERNKRARIQFIVIASLDAILAILFTFHLAVRSFYVICSSTTNSTDDEDTFNQSENKYTDCIRLVTLLGVSLSMWYSVGIGVYRSIDIDIFWAYYIGFLPRAILSITSAVKFFIPSRIESSLLQTVSTVVKWKQLGKVTVFYFMFVMLFALLGVHIIGGLEYICVYNNGTPAVPITHCNPNTTLGQVYCPSVMDVTEGDYQLSCQPLTVPNSSAGTFFLNYRTFVYYGQYSTFISALYAVYEATTLELWSFMMVAGFQGKDYIAVAIFYAFLVLFVVILLQQSLFLVVIIESFADLRSQAAGSVSADTSNQKPQQINKPNTVLSLQNGSDSTLRLKSKVQKSSRDFITLYGSTLRKMETFFLILVLCDALVTGLKRADINPDTQVYWKYALQIWQFSVSALFLLEVIILFLFHLYHGQWKLFFKRPYYICLCILAIGGILAAVPNKYFYDPLHPANAVILFQALRFPRLIRISKYLQEFFLKILGNFRIPILILITVAIIGFLAIVNSQIFTYKVSQCPSLQSDHYSTYLEAFLATFQLVMNEAWTDVTSELMCRTGYEWIFTNLYFIIIHLFSSLIFLNYFGAVILDNLEYDEAEKMNKLEEIKRKEASADTVPLHLRIFKKLNNQPKRLRPPGIKRSDLNLEEVEVRRFFESASMPLSAGNLGFHDYVTPPIITPEPLTPASDGRNSSQLRQLSLVSTNEDIFQNDTTPGLQRKYQNITAILKFVKLWRQYTEETSTNSNRSTHLPYLFGGDNHMLRNKAANTKTTRSEFDEFRENHRFFDQVLFCMPPEHKLRKFCTFLLTAQAEAPKSLGPNSGSLLGLASRLSFGIKWVVSQLPYYTWIMFICLTCTVFIQFGEQVKSNRTDDKIDYYYIIITEVLYVFYMLLWLLVRVLSKGFFLNPHAAISSYWDILDWIFVIDSILLLVLLPQWLSPTDTRLDNGIVKFPSYSSLPLWTVILMIIRSLRPLHIVSLFRSLRDVIKEILEGYKNLLAGTVIMVGFMYMFASLGVQLFSGTIENPLAFCNDPNIKTQEKCVGEFYITLKTSREFLHVPDVAGSEYMLVPRVWFPYARDYPFNNVLYATATLFELLTLEGWTEVKDLFNGKGNEQADVQMKIYIHIYLFLAVNLGLQLFLGIVVNNFNEHKPDHRFLLSVDQNRWVELMQRLSLQRPYKIPQQPRQNIVRLKLYNFLTHTHYRIIPTVITILSAFTLVIPWDITISEGIKALVYLNIIFNVYTIFEVIGKLFAFGPTFFQSWRNIFDMLLAIVTFVYIIFALIYFTVTTVMGDTLLRPLSFFALAIVVCKVLTILVKYSAMLNLLITVGTTIVRSIPLILVLLIIIFCYSLSGVILFGDISKGETLEYSYFNYAGTEQSLNLISRSLTGEDWYQIMWDVGLKDPYGLKLNGTIWTVIISMIYFVSFIIIVPFILLNVFIAVLLENFSIFYNDDDTNLSLSVIKDFKRNWQYFNPPKGFLDFSQLKLLLRSLELQDFYSYTLGEPDHTFGRVKRNLTDDPLLLWEMEEELKREVALPVDKTTPSQQNGVSFLTVLRMLAYRCEDINTRLESHELYAREELETTIQIDVAEMCILRWMKKYVKPIVDWDRSQIPSVPDTTVTVTHSSRESTVQNRQYQLFSLHNMQSQLVGTNWGKSPSMDTEDEEGGGGGGGGMDSQRLSRLFPPMTTAANTNEVDSEEDTVLARTYHKMMQGRNKEMEEAKERAKEWLQLQQDWNNQIGSDPNYFDDGL